MHSMSGELLVRLLAEAVPVELASMIQARMQLSVKLPLTMLIAILLNLALSFVATHLVLSLRRYWELAFVQR